MPNKHPDAFEPDSAETLFHDIATPLLITKMKAELLALHLPDLIRSILESPDLLHLLPRDKKIVEAMINAPDIMVTNVYAVQKKMNLLSESVLLQNNRYVSHTSPPSPSASINIASAPINVDSGESNGQCETDTSSGSSVKTVAIKTILLVDDETIHRDIGHSVLSPHYQVDFADNGVDAVQKCEIKQYDLILMDLHMPKMNGEQATMALRKQVSKETIIIGLTSLPLGANQSGLLAKGFTGFLEKPLTMKGLQNVLRAYSRYA